MRFGQLPSVREMTPDITPLLQARQMKDQAFQNITGTISQLAAQKQKKELDKEKTQQAIAAVSPFIEALKANNPELRKTNFNAADLVKSVGADKAISQVQDLMKSMNEENFRENQLKLQRRANRIAAREFTASENQKILEAQKEEKDAQITDQKDLLNSAIRSKLSDAPLSRINATSVQEVASEIIKEDPEKYSSLSSAEVARTASSAMSGKIDSATKIAEGRKEEGAVAKIDVELEKIYRGDREKFFKGLEGTRTSLRTQSLILQDAEAALKIFEELGKISGVDLDAGGEALDRIIKSRIPGADVEELKFQLQALASKIGTEQLQDLRRQSVDGSSGFGQLTQNELDALQSSMGKLIDSEGNIINFKVTIKSLRKINEIMKDKQGSVARLAKNIYKPIADNYQMSEEDFNFYITDPLTKKKIDSSDTNVSEEDMFPTSE